MDERQRDDSGNEELSIGFTAQRLNVSVRTLRYYEELGLVQPLRDASGYRRYGSQQLEELDQVLW